MLTLQSGYPLGTDISTSEIQDNAVTGAKIAMGSDAQGDILYYNGTNYTRLGFGTSGQFLKTQGTGANVIWGDAGAGTGHIFITTENYSSIGAGTWVQTLNSSFWYCKSLGNDTGSANADNITYKVYLAAGTYTLKIWARTQPNAPILDIDIGGSEVASHDLYSGGVVDHVNHETTGIIIATGGIKDLRLRVDGKNGSSGDYNVTIQSLALYRTA